MSIVAAFMVPHPPMIVPDIGRGSEKQIENIKRFLKDFDTENLNKMQATQILNRLFCR